MGRRAPTAAPCRRLSLDTYHPESGRYGGGTALAAAEELFAADSTAALAQLAAQPESGIDRQALTAASMVDLAASMLGSRTDGCEWLVARPEQAGQAPIDRNVLRQAVTLDPSELPEPIQHAWQERSRAAARYAAELSAVAGPLTPASVLTSLIHLHFVRAHGPDEDAEQLTYRFARHVALAASASPGSRRRSVPMTEHRCGYRCYGRPRRWPRASPPP